MDAAPLALSGPRSAAAFVFAAAVHVSLAVALGRSGVEAARDAPETPAGLVHVSIVPRTLRVPEPLPVRREAPRPATSGAVARSRATREVPQAAPMPERPAIEAPVEPLPVAQAPLPPAAARAPAATAGEVAPPRETVALAAPPAQLVRMPALLHAPAPAYPAAAREDGQEGQVVLRVRVSARGAPDEVVLARSSGFRLLDAAAIAAVREWRFIPARHDGREVDSWMEVPVRFRLG